MQQLVSSPLDDWPGDGWKPSEGNKDTYEHRCPRARLAMDGIASSLQGGQVDPPMIPSASERCGVHRPGDAAAWLGPASGSPQAQGHHGSQPVRRRSQPGITALRCVALRAVGSREQQASRSTPTASEPVASGASCCLFRLHVALRHLPAKARGKGQRATCRRTPARASP